MPAHERRVEGPRLARKSPGRSLAVQIMSGRAPLIDYLMLAWSALSLFRSTRPGGREATRDRSPRRQLGNAPRGRLYVWALPPTWIESRGIGLEVTIRTTRGTPTAVPPPGKPRLECSSKRRR